MLIKFVSYLRTLLPPDIRYPWREPRGIWYTEVKNLGSSTCSSVSLTLPTVTAVKVEREGREPENLKVNAVIELGDLKPKDVIKITGWGDNGIDEDAIRASLRRRHGTYFETRGRFLGLTFGELVLPTTHRVHVVVFRGARDRRSMATARPVGSWRQGEFERKRFSGSRRFG